MSLFFIALLPPPHIQDYVNQIKQNFADDYGSSHAQKSPPHITLQPPFEWQDDNLTVLESCLQGFVVSKDVVPITLNGFGAFVPRVIYIHVEKSSELLALQIDLMAYVEKNLGIVDQVSKTRAFAPHMTVAFRDLSKQNFKAAWQKYQQRELYFEFIGAELTLLRHNKKRWHIQSQFSLNEKEDDMLPN
ncbi:2'-5' RNA ligase family protein [Calothrix rhizosoleniae]|uniref:2'-5' RNA ligase family protein n=1 Tax=Calothrix rhizosoleniae TaxID=888997 RepID=UPI000B4A4107|nr:2'-5' RNA ligase family protein [Calothrix rhizosoleniae]